MKEKEQSIIIPNGTIISDETRRAAWREARWSPRFRSLPQDAELIAGKHANKLNAPLLKKPLSEFLSASASVADLKGISIVHCHDPLISATFLSICALANLNDVYDESVSGDKIRSLVAIVGKLYDKFDDVATQIGFPVRGGIGYINTGGKGMGNSTASAFRKLREYMITEETDVYPILYTFARIPEAR